MGGRNKRRRSQKSGDKQIAAEAISFEAIEKIANNQDLLTEILSRLPAKSLCRFMLVSTNWRDMISDPHLRKLIKLKSASGMIMTRRMRKDNQLYDSNAYYFVPLDDEMPVSKVSIRLLDFIGKQRVEILQSCNGLLLCRSPPSQYDKSYSKYYICNPLTKKFKLLPRPQGGTGAVISGISLHASKRDDYKLVAFSHDINNIGTKFVRRETYSSVTRAWRSIITDSISSSERFSNVLDGGIIRNIPAIHQPLSQYFDVDTKDVSEMNFSFSIKIQQQHFGESNGHLHLVQRDFNKGTHVFICEMAQDCSSWFPKQHIVFNNLVDQRYLTVFALLHRENDQESFLVTYTAGQVFGVNIKTGHCHKFCDWKLNKTEIRYLVRERNRAVHHYIENPFARV